MNLLLCIGALWGLVSVMMGAMADHAFSLDAAGAQTMETAIRYNMLYAVLITGLSLVEGRPLVRLAGKIFAGGSIVFSASLYLAVMTGIGVLTYATPIGGLTLMAGWALLAFAALRAR